MLLKITRDIKIPDSLKVERFKRTPDIGPKILFFSGGTAIKNLSQELLKYTHNSIHVISTFDSGGSSAKLRDVFKMPAIGDIRNRLMALADRSFTGNPEIFNLFAYRFPKNKDNTKLKQEFMKMINGNHPLVAKIHDPMRKIIRHYLYLFKKNIPKTFDFSNASIGNLILTGGYIENKRHLDPVIYIFSRLVQVRGVVRPILNKHLHLIAELEDGRTIVGQHLITGKDVLPINSRIKNLYISETTGNPEPLEIPIRNKLIILIQEAELICYPMGSFFSSILANFLPKKTGTTISQTNCPKIFIPNTGNDPEAYEMDLNLQIDKLLYYLKKDDPNTINTSDVLNYVLIDSNYKSFYKNINYKNIKKLGIEIIASPIISEDSYPYIDEKLLLPVILSLC
ncbi:MAG: GAK system CofD-like protein [Desulfobacterales bacterium]|nr:GAK system CofD-like protein [Desulfobacterales bacterium]